MAGDTPAPKSQGFIRLILGIEPEPSAYPYGSPIAQMRASFKRLCIAVAVSVGILVILSIFILTPLDYIQRDPHAYQLLFGCVLAFLITLAPLTAWVIRRYLEFRRDSRATLQIPIFDFRPSDIDARAREFRSHTFETFFFLLSILALLSYIVALVYYNPGPPGEAAFVLITCYSGIVFVIAAASRSYVVFRVRRYELRRLQRLPLPPPPPPPEDRHQRAARLLSELQTTNTDCDYARGLSDDERTRHVWIPGTSGVGKSTFMQWLAITDICQPVPDPPEGISPDFTPPGPKRGVTVIDPAGSLVRKLLDCIPERRVQDTIYFDLKNPIPIDFFSWTDPAEKPIIVSSIIALFESLSERTGSTVGSVIESVLIPLIYTLLDAKDVSFLDIYNFLEYESRRKEILNQPTIEQRLKDHWAAIPKFTEQMKGPIVRRLAPIYWNPAATTVFGSRGHGALKIADVLSDNKVLLVDLAAGQPEVQKIVAALIISKLVQAAFSQDPNDPNRPYHMLYIDEFPSVQVLSDFTTILSQARKFRLCLTVANQWFSQIDSEVFQGLLSVGNIYLFRLQHEDANRFRQAGMLIRQKELYNRADKKESPSMLLQELAKHLPADQFMEVREVLMPLDVLELTRLPAFRAIHRKSTGPVQRVSTPEWTVFTNLAEHMPSPAERIRNRTLEPSTCNPEQKPDNSDNGKPDPTPTDPLTASDDAGGPSGAGDAFRPPEQGPRETTEKTGAKSKRHKDDKPEP